MEQDPHQPDKNKKPLWPWVLAQFLPCVMIPVIFFSLPIRMRSFNQDWLLVLAYAYAFILSFFFFHRRQNKNVLLSVLFSVGAAFVVLMMNAVVFVSVFFVGCLCALSRGGFGG